jgi:hypothetical protein
LSLAIKNAKKDNMVKIRHSKNIGANFQLVSESMKKTVLEFQETTELWQQMAKKEIKMPEFKAYLSEVFKGEYKKDISDYKYYGQLLEFNEAGIGSDIPGVRGTLWGAYQSTTQLITHNLGLRKNDELNNDDSYSSRTNSLLFGKSSNLTRNALEVAKNFLN